MVDLKLGPLPQQRTVKVTIILSEPLKEEIDVYAAEHNRLYGQSAEIGELIPHMLQTFLRADRVWCRLRKQRSKGQPAEVELLKSKAQQNRPHNNL